MTTKSMARAVAFRQSTIPGETRLAKHMHMPPSARLMDIRCALSLTAMSSRTSSRHHGHVYVVTVSVLREVGSGVWQAQTT